VVACVPIGAVVNCSMNRLCVAQFEIKELCSVHSEVICLGIVGIINKATACIDIE